jgi:hypothetical protein
MFHFFTSKYFPGDVSFILQPWLNGELPFRESCQTWARGLETLNLRKNFFYRNYTRFAGSPADGRDSPTVRREWKLTIITGEPFFHHVASIQ